MRKSLGKSTFESILQNPSPASLRIVRAKKKKKKKKEKKKKKKIEETSQTRGDLEDMMT